ncbi:MAG: DUF429 domain-containing protein [Streptosporangiaceae bacterium]|jgi:predicted RNase H-like nuclease
MSTSEAFFTAQRVTGVDGCRDGWVAIDLGEGGSLAAVRTAASLDDLLAGTADPQVVGIDMPLGLPAGGWRTADREARALLGPRRSSIFAIPPAAVWQAPTYGAANRLCRELTGNGFSAQAWGLRRKLLEAAEYRQRGPHPLYEVHPELSFRMMAGAPLEHAKHTAAGRAQRRALLAREGIVMPGDRALGRIAVDVLDAAAAAWSARRIAAGHARVLPDPPQADPTGRDIAILY